MNCFCDINFYCLKVTTEQEDYAKGFEDALTQLRNIENGQNNNNNAQQQQQQQNQIMVNSMSGGSVTYTNLGEHLQKLILFYLTIINSLENLVNFN